MPLWLMRTFIVGFSLMVIACAVGLVVALLPFSGVPHSQAAQRWEQRKPVQYEMELTWNSDWSSGHVLAQIENNRIVGGTNLETGAPLVPIPKPSMNYFISVDNQFRLIEGLSQLPTGWRDQIARYHPLLARWLHSCAAPPPRVHYNEHFGYPQKIIYQGSSCHAVNQDVTVSIVKFQPLIEEE
ncbi:MAG: hypothetical protein GFH27_549357n21 [Chloroflexi bacterium AL-W]|nr:hypothetical protein [Chloroflexi bacterium AL-N1]NOK70658.1 hypothetical protein [Chloroflexi bacterium AL-N10]NOK78477.1 hypothetical protein [Chloroflexi bacterium AL-N5]NOK85561.1 hypothetical protein [Chloroflexi bacterium AL-W]NOK92475.1 hypothetical protein [Chloroflexi bacterium AL-N15]